MSEYLEQQQRTRERIAEWVTWLEGGLTQFRVEHGQVASLVEGAALLARHIEHVNVECCRLPALVSSDHAGPALVNLAVVALAIRLDALPRRKRTPPITDDDLVAEWRRDMYGNYLHRSGRRGRPLHSAHEGVGELAQELAKYWDCIRERTHDWLNLATTRGRQLAAAAPVIRALWGIAETALCLYLEIIRPVRAKVIAPAGGGHA